MAPVTPKLPDVPGVDHREIDVNGVRLHVAQAGAGPPLLLLHGWPQHWWCWRELIPRLTGTRRVIAPDLRGWGWSSAPPGDYAKGTLAADVLALLDCEGLDQVDLVGHDWGGYAGFLLALSHPDRVRRMVAVDIPPPWSPRPHLRHLALPLLLSYQALLATPGLGEAALTRSDALVKAIIRRGSRLRQWSEDELRVYADVLRAPARARASSACYRTFLTRELGRGHEPEELRVPTLLVMGSASLIHRVANPQPSRNLAVREIHGAGHFIPEEAPDQLLQLAGDFLSA
ncbi:MAG: alpha/beta fold hydrolase [Solirubrobacteraceae bacterium]